MFHPHERRVVMIIISTSLYNQSSVSRHSGRFVGVLSNDTRCSADVQRRGIAPVLLCVGGRNGIGAWCIE